MIMGNNTIPEHKRLAMGMPYAKGGLVDKDRKLKSGFGDSPIEKSKRANGVPGYSKGGMAKRGARGC